MTPGDSTERPTRNPIPTIPDASTSPRLRLDDRGRALPLTEAERADLAESTRRALEALASFPNDPPGSDREFMRAIDEGRPDRPLFSDVLKAFDRP